MQLHWSPKSPYVRKVMVCAHELGLVPRIRCVRTVAAMLRPNETLMRDNPLSKIPTLVLEDGTALYDSAVICEYLDDLARGNLFPPSGAARWRALRWQALGDGLLDVLILWRNERERETPLPDLLNAFECKTRAALDCLEQASGALAEAPWSIGQIAVGCALGYLDYRFEAFGWRARAPRLAQWQAVVDARPSFAATRAQDG